MSKKITVTLEIDDRATVTWGDFRDAVGERTPANDRLEVGALSGPIARDTRFGYFEVSVQLTGKSLARHLGIETAV
jgi:hypothetical protein